MNVKAILKAIWFTPGSKHRWGLPVLLEGPPGSAKTSHVEEAAREAGLHCETVIASIREPADFLGLPIPHGERGAMLTEYTAPSWASRLAKTGRGVAFLDELNTAPPAVQAALLRVVLDGVAGDLVLPSAVRFVAAQNRVEEAAGGHDLSMPLANRFIHWRWDAPSVEEWSEWFLSAGGNGGSAIAGGNPEQLEDQVLKEWPEAFAKARGLVAAFLGAKRDLLSKVPRPDDPQSSHAFATPRTWEMAARVVAGAEIHDLGEIETDMLVGGCVGEGVARELKTYRNKMDLPNPADVLDKKAKFAPDDKLDRTMAVLASCAALVTPENAAKRDTRAAALWVLLKDIVKTDADVAVPAARALVRAKLARMAEARETLTAINPVLKRAGIQA
jgi:MoxR-like ATPase